MRRLLLLVCALVWVDTLLYAALTPLLPHFEETLGLSKTGVGVLVAAYAAGALVGGLPGGAAAARLGPRRAVLVGLALMGLASLGFAFANGFWASTQITSAALGRRKFISQSRVGSSACSVRRRQSTSAMSY